MVRWRKQAAFQTGSEGSKQSADSGVSWGLVGGSWLLIQASPEAVFLKQKSTLSN